MLPWVRVIGPDAWVVLEPARGAVLRRASAAAVVRLQRLAWWPLAIAATWVLVELGRSHVPFTGFPWGRLAFATPTPRCAGYVRWSACPR